MDGPDGSGSNAGASTADGSNIVGGRPLFCVSDQGKKETFRSFLMSVDSSDVLRLFLVPPCVYSSVDGQSDPKCGRSFEFCYFSWTTAEQCFQGKKNMNHGNHESPHYYRGPLDGLGWWKKKTPCWKDESLIFLFLKKEKPSGLPSSISCKTRRCWADKSHLRMSKILYNNALLAALNPRSRYPVSSFLSNLSSDVNFFCFRPLIRKKVSISSRRWFAADRLLCIENPSFGRDVMAGAGRRLLNNHPRGVGWSRLERKKKRPEWWTQPWRAVFIFIFLFLQNNESEPPSCAPAGVDW